MTTTTKFVQIIEFTTSRIDDVKALSEQYRAERGDDAGPTRAYFTQDRDKPNTYLNIVEFDSYEEAMANSENPATSSFAQKMSELVDGPPVFRNLDVADTWTR
jgi:quinol monooxygenase YgiN